MGMKQSPGSAWAVNWCADVAAAGSAEVIAVCAFESHPRWGLSDSDVAGNRGGGGGGGGDQQRVGRSAA